MRRYLYHFQLRMKNVSFSRAYKKFLVTTYLKLDIGDYVDSNPRKAAHKLFKIHRTLVYYNHYTKHCYNHVLVEKNFTHHSLNMKINAHTPSLWTGTRTEHFEDCYIYMVLQSWMISFNRIGILAEKGSFNLSGAFFINLLEHEFALAKGVRKRYEIFLLVEI